VHGIIALFLEIIVLVIILFLVGLVVLRVLIVATRTIMASIVFVRMLTATWKALSHANAKGTGTDDWVIRSLDD
jgi:hypothetical protein